MNLNAMRRSFCVSLSIAILGSGVGCGGSQGPKRIAVRGTVSVEALPSLDGSISFVPAGEHRGPAANGVIQGGQYQISAAEGPTVGSHLAIISLVPSKSTDPMGSGNLSTPSSVVNLARTKWEVKVEIDDKKSTHDFKLKPNE